MSKKLWITGASSGIGKAVAEKFAKEGWKVAVSARRVELLEKLAVHENISSFPLDVTNSENCKTTFKQILQKFNNIGTAMKCFYMLHNNTNYKSAIKYSFEFCGFIDVLTY